MVWTLVKMLLIVNDITCRRYSRLAGMNERRVKSLLEPEITHIWAS